jgi:hypothetical protein
MSGAHEKLEQAEHASHGGGHNRLFGVTMAMMGVLIAFSSALVGSERNELTRTMIEQTQAHSDWTAASTKFRLIMIELEKQRARVITQQPTAPESGSPVERFIELAGDYAKERTLSKSWSDSYLPIVEAHFGAAEGYEHAQLIAEIGIVLASLGVLLSSRPAWLISVFLGVACLVQIGHVFFPTRHILHSQMDKVHQAEESYQDLRKAHTGANMDDLIIERLDPDGKIRKAIEARSAHKEPGKEESK